jgi:hypothetical protein
MTTRAHTHTHTNHTHTHTHTPTYKRTHHRNAVNAPFIGGHEDKRGSLRGEARLAVPHPDLVALPFVFVFMSLFLFPFRFLFVLLLRFNSIVGVAYSALPFHRCALLSRAVVTLLRDLVHRLR